MHHFIIQKLIIFAIRSIKMLRILNFAFIYAVFILSMFNFGSSRSLNEDVSRNTTELEIKDGKEINDLEGKINQSIQENEENFKKYDISKEEEETTAAPDFEEFTTTTVSISDDESEYDRDFEFENAVHSVVRFTIREVVNIDESAETITLALDIYINWNVNATEVNMEYFLPSLQYRKQYYVKPGIKNEIWTPTIIFKENAHLSKQTLINHLPSLIYREKIGEMTYSSREVIKFNCPMNFQYYPADYQQCDFTIYDDTQGRMVLITGEVYYNDLDDNDFDVQFIQSGGEWGSEYFNKTYYGHYKFTLSVRRKLGYHMVQTYLPSFLYILITCLCFLVPSHMVEVRMGISMTTLLTLTAMFASVRESTPTVSYVKAIDIWMAFCIFFVFLTLLEFTTLLWLRSQRAVAEEKRLQDQKKLEALKSVIGGKCLAGPVAGMERSFSVKSLPHNRYEKFAEIVEKYGFIVFSFLFLTFVVIYWSWLIEASGYYKWDNSKNE